jgi:hypothetical protein
MATSAVFGQHTQSINFSGPTVWTPGTTVTVDDFLTFSGYNAYGLSYWLEVQSAVAPYVAITDIQFIEFPRPQPPPFPILFTTAEAMGTVVKQESWAVLTIRLISFLLGLITLAR